MSKNKVKEFKEKYKNDSVVTNALSEFDSNNIAALTKKNRKFMCQFMATVGLEVEARFKEVEFDHGKFKLFGRKKSKKSIDTKKKLNIESFLTNYEQAIANGEENIPTQIRPIYDFYAFKFVVPDIKNIDNIKKQVVVDFLDDIKSTSSAQYQEILEEVGNFTKIDDMDTVNKFVEAIDNKFSDKYPNLKHRFDTIDTQIEEVDKIDSFIKKSKSINISQITYRDYYKLLDNCYTILKDLSYEQCYEEHQEIDERAKISHDKLAKLEEENKADKLIPIGKLKKRSKQLKKLLSEVKSKKTNKLNLSVGDLMIFDILSTSKQIKNLGITYSRDPLRAKAKRMPNGYVANFYSLDMPNGLTSELQVQSRYRYEYGEHGPAAHNLMANQLKARVFIDRPKSKKKYPNWEKKQFKALPSYFTYKGGGNIHLYNTIDNFRRYYDCESPDKVKKYAQYIVSHNIELLYTDFIHFRLDSPSVLQSKEKEQNDNKERE